MAAILDSITSSHQVRCFFIAACAVFIMLQGTNLWAQQARLPVSQQEDFEERWQAQRDGVRNAVVTFHFIGIPPARAATHLTEDEVAFAISLLDCEDHEDGFTSLAATLSSGEFESNAGLEVALRVADGVRVEETELVHQLHDSETVVRKSKANRQIDLYPPHASHRFSHNLDDLRIPAPPGLSGLPASPAGDGRVQLTTQSSSGKIELSYVVQTDGGLIEMMVMSDRQSGHRLREIYNLCHHEYASGQWFPRFAVRVDYDGGMLKRAYLRRILQATFNTSEDVGPFSVPAAEGDTIVDMRSENRRVFKTVEAVADVKAAQPPREHIPAEGAGAPLDRTNVWVIIWVNLAIVLGLVGIFVLRRRM